MANILLVYPAPGKLKERRFGFSIDLLYLSSLLKQAGHHIVAYLDYTLEPFNREKFRRSVAKAGVIILEFDSFPLKRAVNITHGESLARLIKNDFPARPPDEKKIILYGNDIALFPEHYPYEHLGHPLAKGTEQNIGIILAALLEGKPTPHPLPIKKFDDLPLPDRSLLTPAAQHGASVDSEPHLQKSTLVRTSTGCPNACIFCQRKAWNKTVQTHSIPYVLNEFAELKKSGYKNIWITDDNFTSDLDRAKSLLKALTERRLTEQMKIALSSWTRIDEEFLENARNANVSIISFGVESADPDIQKFYRKTIHLEKFREHIRTAGRLGLYTVGNFIIGAPMETEETIAKTFDYIMQTPFDRVNIKILDYMAGSGLYESLPQQLKTPGRHVFACKENGLNDFPLEQMREKIHRFREEFYRSRQKQLKKKIAQSGPPYYHIA
jgi:uncharacterized radical SAM superfamily protein